MPSYEPFDWYEQPLYYDIVFDETTEQEADFLEEALRRYGRGGGCDVLEPACGSGRLVAALASRRYQVTGFDINESALSFARRRLKERGVRATLKKARMEDFSLPGAFDLAHCMVSTFKYLLSEEAARAHLHRVAGALRAGGIYVLGLHVTDCRDRRCNRERWVVSRDGLEVTCNIQGWPADRATRTERVRSRLIVREHGHERRYETSWTFRTYSAAQLKSLIASVPSFEHLETFNFLYDIDDPIPLDGTFLDCVLILRKRG